MYLALLHCQEISGEISSKLIKVQTWYGKAQVIKVVLLPDVITVARLNIGRLIADFHIKIVSKHQLSH